MISVYFDGSKAARTGCGFVVKRGTQTLTEGHKTLAENPSNTSNVAEYAGFIYGLSRAIPYLAPGEPLKIIGDSLLVINQVKGLFKVKAKHLQPLCEMAQKRIEALKQDGHVVTLAWVERSKNSHADSLASKASKSPSCSGPNLTLTEETQDHAV